jgi:hypothetical protein
MDVSEERVFSIIRVTRIGELFDAFFIVNAVKNIKSYDIRTNLAERRWGGEGWLKTRGELL